MSEDSNQIIEIEDSNQIIEIEDSNQIINEPEEIHEYLKDFELDKAKRHEEKIAAKKAYMKIYKQTYIKKPKERDAWRTYDLQKYHRNKKLTHCDVCDADFIYITKHKMTQRHISKLSNPLDLIKDLFPDIVNPIIKESEELKETNAKLDSKIDEITVKPLQIISKKNKYGKTKFSFV